MREAAEKAGYMVCEKHPYLVATSATASALGCPYCKLEVAEQNIEELKDYSFHETEELVKAEQTIKDIEARLNDEKPMYGRLQSIQAIINRGKL